MTVDLQYDELVLLCQFVNKDFCDKQRKTNAPTPFEAQLFKKLYDAQEKGKGNHR